MGQTESKLRGSTPFAYVLNSQHQNIPRPNISAITEEQDIYNDQLLEQPELYGLRNNSYPFLPRSTQPSSSSASFGSLPTASTNKHRDSGYVSPSYYDESVQLINDLNYIDQTYYAQQPPMRITKAIQTNDQNNNNHHSQNNGTNQIEGAAYISFADTMACSPDKTLQEVYLSCRSVYRLSSDIGMLTMIRKLDLSNNFLIELPESIGHISSLETLVLTKNRLKALPETISYLSNLQELDVSMNEIQYITPCISYLDKLKILSLAYNQIRHLPVNISGLTGLITLDLSHNPLQLLPAEISQLPYLRRLRLDDCPFNSDLIYSLKHNAPSLVEVCARNIIRNKVNIDLLPENIVKYIKSAKACTSCGGPYYESFVLRGRLMEKTDMHIPLQYTLCSAHWSDADDRILNMFSSRPSTSNQMIQQPYRPNLPCPPKASIDNKLSNAITTTRRKHVPTTENNIVVDTSALEEVNNNQLVPATTGAKCVLNQSKSSFLTSIFKKTW